MKNSDALNRVDKEPLELERAESFNELGRSNNDYTYGYGLEDSRKRINLTHYWQAIRKRLWLILGLTAIVTLLVTVYVAQKPDYYQSTARVQVNLENNPAMGAPKGFVYQGVYDPTYFSSQLQIIEGSGLLRRVVNTHDLVNNKAFLNPRSSQPNSVAQNVLRMLGLGESPNTSQPQVSRDVANLNAAKSSELSAVVTDDKEIEQLAPYVRKLKGGLTVHPVKEQRVNYKETRLIDIKYIHDNPEVAAKIANAIADTYVSQNYEQKIDTNATAGSFLQKRIADLQSQIRTNEERLINYAKNHQIISLDVGQNTVVQRLADLNSKLSQAEADRIVAEAAYRASQLPGAANAQTAADGRTAALESRLNDLQAQRARLLVEYTEEAPELVEINKQIALTEQQIKDTRNRATTNLATNLEARFWETRTREQNLRTIFNEQRAQVVAQNEAAISYRIIQQEILTDKSLLDGLLQRSKENDVVLSGTPNNVLVVDRAIIPRAPLGPDRGMYIGLAFITSLGFGIGLALLLNYLDDTLRTVDDVETELHLPVLSAIPSISRSRAMLKLTNSLGRMKGSAYSTSVVDLENKPALSEAYMHLRTSVLLATAGGPPEVLLVTSGQPSEGKTTTAINLASVLAQTGARVLLIDADLRRPSVHTILGLNHNGYDPSKGLSNLLTSKTLDEATVTDSIKFHNETGLHVITAGTLPPNPANLLCSKQMEQLLSTLRPQFTHIVIDSPPITFFTDGVLLSRVVDGVLLVVRSGQSHLDVASHARKLLWDAGAKFFGVVLNDVSRQHTKYYGYGYEYEPQDEFPKSEPGLLKLDAN